MRKTYAPKLNDQAVVPFFHLPSNRETMISPRDFRQKNNLVILFFHSADCSQCRSVLTQFAVNYPRYREMETEVLAISITSVEGAKRLAAELNLPFPVLADDTGKVSEQFTYIDPATRTPVPGVFVVDRFGALYAQTIAEKEAGLPKRDEIADWLNLIELQCPECGVSEWSMTGRDSFTT